MWQRLFSHFCLLQQVWPQTAPPPAPSLLPCLCWNCQWDGVWLYVHSCMKIRTFFKEILKKNDWWKCLLNLECIFKCIKILRMHLNHFQMYNTVALSTLTVFCGHHHCAFPELFCLSSQKFGPHEIITPHSSLSSVPGNHHHTLCFCKFAYFKIPKTL